MYGLALTAPLCVLFLIFGMSGDGSMSDAGVIAAVIVFAAVYVLLWLLGKAIFDFTERKYKSSRRFAKRAHLMAELTEFAVSIAALGLMTGVPLLVTHFIEGD